MVYDDVLYLLPNDLADFNQVASRCINSLEGVPGKVLLTILSLLSQVYSRHT